jgi:hypothetical protein
VCIPFPQLNALDGVGGELFVMFLLQACRTADINFIRFVIDAFGTTSRGLQKNTTY